MADSKLKKAQGGAKKGFGAKKRAGGAKQPCEYTWVEIKLIDDDGDPVPYEPYTITMADDTVVRGRLDKNGFARVSGIHTPGTCQISFTKIHEKCWKPA